MPFPNVTISVEPSAYSEDSFQTIKLFPPTAAEAADAGGVDVKKTAHFVGKADRLNPNGPHIFF